MKQIFKKTMICITIAGSITLQAESFNQGQVNEFECSPEEMAEIVDRSKVKERITQTTYDDFSAPYQETSVAKAAGKQPSELTASDKSEHNDLSCLTIDPGSLSEFYEDLEKAWETLSGVVAGAGGKISDAMSDFIKKAQEELSQGLCGKFGQAAQDALKEKAKEAGEIFKAGMEDRIREEKWGKLLDGESGALYLLDKQLNESYNDKEGLLKWRDGKVDKNFMKSKANKLFQKELDDIYDDFDDQVDEDLGID